MPRHAAGEDTVNPREAGPGTIDDWPRSEAEQVSEVPGGQRTDPPGRLDARGPGDDRLWCHHFASPSLGVRWPVSGMPVVRAAGISWPTVALPSGGLAAHYSLLYDRIA